MHYRRFKRYGNSNYTKVEMHGMSSFPEYNSWFNMINRCYNIKNISYKYYGARGITVCWQWKNSFTAFYEDVGPKPFPKAQIDRINNDLGYFLENCHWVTPAQNSQHQSKTKLTMEKARAIRKIYKFGDISQKKLATIYGVVQSNIHAIVNQNTWKEVI